jgi:hypothetical protein
MRLCIFGSHPIDKSQPLILRRSRDIRSLFLWIVLRASLMTTALTGSVGFATPPTDCTPMIPAYNEASFFSANSRDFVT